MLFRSILNILALLLLSYLVYNNKTLDKNRNRALLFTIFILIIIILSEIATTSNVGERVVYRNLNNVANVVGFSLSPFVPILLARVFGGPRVRLRLTHFIPSIVNVICAILSPFIGIIFFITEENIYLRGSGFIVYIAVCLFNCIIFVYIATLSIRQYHNANRVYIIFGSLLVVIGSACQVAVPSIHTTWISITMSLILYYAFHCDSSVRYDVLTGLLNRRAYREDIEVHTYKYEEKIIVVSIDDIEQLNQAYGYRYIDYCVVTVGYLLERDFAGHGVCYRMGSNQFRIICDDTEEKVALRIETVKKDYDKLRKKERTMPNISISFGDWRE